MASLNLEPDTPAHPVENVIPLIRPAIHLLQNTQKHSQNVKNEKCTAGYFASLFRISGLFFTFCILRQDWHLHKKSKNYVVNFFVALIKQEICMKYKKCIVSVSYFMVCFAKTHAKYPRNAKYKKSITSLRSL